MTGQHIASAGVDVAEGVDVVGLLGVLGLAPPAAEALPAAAGHLAQGGHEGARRPVQAVARDGARRGDDGRRGGGRS